MCTIEQATSALTKGVKEVSPGADTVNVLSAVVRQTINGQQQDVSISRISRSEYLNVPNKLTEARPTQYYVQRTISPTIFLWPAADKDYTLVYYRIRRIQDAGAYTNTTDVNFRFLPCLASGLAYMLSLKFAAERTQGLKAIYEEDFLRAAEEDRDTASVHFVPSVGY